MKKNKKNILITRTINKESPFWQLSNDGHKVIARSFVDIIPKTIHEIPLANVYFYYSKNAAKYFLRAANVLQYDLSKSEHAAMGSGTAQMLESLGIKTNFVGVDKPKSIAQSLINKYADTSICFVRADQSTQSIQKFWKNEYSEVIAYSVNPRSIKIQEEIHTIIATSPMNLISALKCCNVKNIKRIVCIGPTTYNAAASISDVDIIMADKANEESMLEAYIKTSKR